MADRIYTLLKESIYRGRLRPGQRIIERDLATRMGVSRIPLRESLRRLESEGLVRSVPNTATFVEDFSSSDILEIYSMRQLLEPEAAWLAAQQADTNLVGRLKRLYDQMTRDTQNRNFPQLDRTDYQFHHAIVVASGHKRLLRAYEGAHIRIVSLQIDCAHLLAMPADTTARQHMDIIQHIEARDPDKARQAAQDHVQLTLVEIERLLQEPQITTPSFTRKDP